MFKVSDQDLIVNDDSNPLAVFIDSFVGGVGEGAQKDTIILRLHHKDWGKIGGLVPRTQVHQFALSAHRAKALGQMLLDLAEQAEKEAEAPAL